MACYDLMGHITGRSASDFFGGRTVEEVPLAALIPLMDAESMVGFAQSFHSDGMNTMRLKLGNSVSEDVHIVKRVRETLGDHIFNKLIENKKIEWDAKQMKAIGVPEAAPLIRCPYREGWTLG